ncbi:hypothetical protein [Aeromonas sp. Y318-3]|uniref:hypothetical protein n=1 Tax=Aeromonas sp. Y318-3 TaxID=2990509 RepID=UPI0022DEFF90|nr:hypothetical protein [Aeromonas sp. Y318-3]
MDKKILFEMLQRRHPEYSGMLEHWDFLKATYEGGRDWFAKNIFPYMKEGQGEFQDRVKRAYRFNHSREVVDLVNKYTFKGEIRRREQDAPECIRKFWGASTRKRASIDTYMRYISKLASVYGRIWVVVDSVVERQGESLAETKSQVYSYEVPPQDVLDLAVDEDGDLRWILIRERVRDDSDPFASSGEVSYRYRLWTREEWFLFSVHFKDKGKGFELSNVEFTIQTDVHELGIVPVIWVDHMISEGIYTAPSLIGDIAYLDRACANYLSNLDAIIQDQTFSQLAIPAQSLLPGDDGHSKVLEAGTKRIFTFDGAEGGKPFFLSPDPKQAELIITSIKQIINEIYHSVGVAGERTKQDNSSGIDNSSGVAKAYDFERVNSLLVNKAASLELAELQMLKLVCKWSGEQHEVVMSGPDRLVHYPRNFDTRTLYDELDISGRIEMLTAPIELKRYQLKQVVSKLYPYISDEDRKEIESAIDEMDDAVASMLSGFDATNKPTKEDNNQGDEEVINQGSKQ